MNQILLSLCLLSSACMYGMETPDEDDAFDAPFSKTRDSSSEHIDDETAHESDINDTSSDDEDNETETATQLSLPSPYTTMFTDLVSQAWTAGSRWTSKAVGSMDVELAGLGSEKERKKTISILNLYRAQLLKHEFNHRTKKQYSTRKQIGERTALTLLEMLQQYSNGTNRSVDIETIMNGASTLLDIHKDHTLPPDITTALEAALELAKQKLKKGKKEAQK